MPSGTRTKRGAPSAPRKGGGFRNPARGRTARPVAFA